MRMAHTNRFCVVLENIKTKVLENLYMRKTRYEISDRLDI